MIRHFFAGASILLLVGSADLALGQSKKGFSIEFQPKGDCTIDTLRLYAWTGYLVEEIAKTTVKTEKNWKGYRFVLPQRPAQGMYYLGKDLSALRHVAVGDKDKKITFAGECADPMQWTSTDSPLNQAYDVLMPKIKANADDYFIQIQEQQAHAQNPEKIAIIKKEMEAIDKRKKHLLDSVSTLHPFLLKIVQLNTYYSYLNNRKEEKQPEGIYFAENFLKQTTISDSTYRRIPYYFEAIQGYASNLTRVGLNTEQQIAYLDALLGQLPADAKGKAHPNFQPTLLAIAFGTMAGNNDLFVKYAKQYVELYRGQKPEIDRFIDERVAKLRGPAGSGELAPNIKEMDPDSNYFELASLRGKYVLIDFWASWCGPCRKENPNVVKLYNKYKDKGFDILGVSLDKLHINWVEAINKDQLSWHHVSDLKGWSSAPAQTYGVTSIPYTVLLDKEGRIIGTRLRGVDLENKLREIFGE